MAQMELARIAPAIGFTAEVQNPLASSGSFCENGKIRRQRAERQFVDEAMALVIESSRRHDENQEEQGPNHLKLPSEFKKRRGG